MKCVLGVQRYCNTKLHPLVLGGAWKDTLKAPPNCGIDHPALKISF